MSLYYVFLSKRCTFHIKCGMRLQDKTGNQPEFLAQFEHQISHTHTPTYKLTNSPTSYKHYFTYIPCIAGLILLYNKNPAINCSPCHPLTLQAAKILIHRLHHRHLQHQVAEPLTGGAGDPGAQSRLAPTHLTSRESNRGKSGSLKRSLASWRRRSKFHLKRSLNTIPIATSTR